MPHKDPEVRRAYKKAVYDADKRPWFRRNLKNFYGITEEIYCEILDAQDYKCALCETPLDLQNNRKVHLDHCHESKKIRGILCMACNVGLGMLGDNEAGLMRALEYVRKSA